MPGSRKSPKFAQDSKFRNVKMGGHASKFLAFSGKRFSIHSPLNLKLIMDMVFSSLQLIVLPLIIPFLPPAAVHFLTENDKPAIEQNVEEDTSSDHSESNINS